MTIMYNTAEGKKKKKKSTGHIPVNQFLRKETNGAGVEECITSAGQDMDVHVTAQCEFYMYAYFFLLKHYTPQYAHLSKYPMR